MPPFPLRPLFPLCHLDPRFHSAMRNLPYGILENNRSVYCYLFVAAARIIVSILLPPCMWMLAASPGISLSSPRMAAHDYDTPATRLARRNIGLTSSVPLRVATYTPVVSPDLYSLLYSCGALLAVPKRHNFYTIQCLYPRS